MRRRGVLLGMLVALVVGLVPAGGARAVEQAGAGSIEATPNLTAVAHVDWRGGAWSGPGGGSDIEFVDLDVTGAAGAPPGVTGTRRFALAGTLGRGLHIVDVTNPRHPDLVKRYDCRVSQGDVQVLRRSAKTYAVYAVDYSAVAGSDCFKELDGQGIPAGTKLGSVFVEITNPYQPHAIGFAREPLGSHNTTLHPSGGYLYNSNSEFRDSGSIEVFDIRADRIRSPRRVARVTLPSGADAHDVTFSASGRRAYVAALNHTVILDTTDPAAPVPIGQINDLAIQIDHQAEPIVVHDPVLGKRTLLMVTDEVSGGGPASCPGGGLHFYDITGNRERDPVKIGAWRISATDFNDGQRGCTAHVAKVHPTRGIMTIAWYRKGVRVLDISGLASVTPGQLQSPIRDIASFAFPDADTWVAKTPAIEADGSFYLFGNDILRGLDVFRFDASAPRGDDPGVWQTAAASAAEAAAAPAETWRPAGRPFYCVIR